MSADNGVYILATKSARRGKREYRVAHAQAIENLSCWDYIDHLGNLNPEFALLLFGKCRVFTDRKLAEGYALRISDEVGYTEYGIKFLDFTHVRFPRPLVFEVVRVIEM
jgi:hypothetical protein